MTKERDLLPTLYQEIIARSRYSRWLPEEGRRENWPETVDRYIDFFKKRFDNDKRIPWEELRQAIVNLEVMPSMRCLMTAGPALDRDNVAGFNCSYLPIDNVRAFDEIVYVLMCGTGVGFSVEQKYVDKLPAIPEDLFDIDETIVVPDSKRGWAKSLRQLLTHLYRGEIPKIDTSRVRPAGARLKVFGGRASGPEPLQDLFDYTIDQFTKAAGRRLTALECHDLVCKIAEIIVVGGVRRSALISLSDIGDEDIRIAKSGRWYEHAPHRALANNSVSYTSTPTLSVFMREFLALYESGSGERGMFSRQSAKEHIEKNVSRRDSSYDFGTNPCSEIILRPNQFCNLSEVVVRSYDTPETLKKKVELATILGTMQASLTDFAYLSKTWKNNTEEEALLGVSMTGIMDCKLTSDLTEPEKLKKLLTELKETAVVTNRKYSKVVGVNESAAITCVKPSGTVSQLVDSASGIHCRHAPFYIRRIRGDLKDPLTKFLIDKGVPYELDQFKPDSTAVFSFPMKAPEGAVCTTDRTAIEQLELWKIYAEYYCEHKPSVTINVQEHEWLDVQAWVYKNFQYISGISFLPYSNHTYKQAPYEEVDEKTYKDLVNKIPDIDWKEMQVLRYETDDNTVGSQELACSGGSCEITDLSNTDSEMVD